MSSYVIPSHRFLLQLTLACAATLAFAACDRIAPLGTQDTSASEMQWARAALERNPQIEVVALDPQNQVFTIRNKSTGEVRAVKLSDLAAAPVSQLHAAAPPYREERVASAEPASSPETSSSSPADVAQQSETPSATAPAAAPVQPREYTIERTDGKVKVSGPGISIVSTAPSAAEAQRAANRRKVDPIICEGPRMLQLDNRTIIVDGDAVTARGGCELYITNSRIVASGRGLVVQDATAHIYNSYVEGSAASFEADGRAKVYVRGSTLHGLSRRDSLAMVQDQGGNEWR